MSRRTSAEPALQRIYTVLVLAAVLAVLALAKDICIPIALASLLTFLLAPLVTRIERWLGRVPAVVTTLLLVSISVVGMGYVVSLQLLDLTAKLPDYHAQVQKKVQVLQESTARQYSRFARAVDAISLELPGASPKPTPARAGGAAAPAPIPVQISAPSDSLGSDAVSVIGPIMSAFALTGLVLLLTVFMLLHREDVRGRIIRLAGQGRISLATTAMHDAGARVFRYLMMQTLVNITFGVLLAIGLYAIGVPNAILWGALSVALRFIPYVGSWIAASLPIALSLAVGDGWTMVAMTVGLFMLLEFTTNNIMEPWLYGASTGVSSLALILAAVFWGWIWGPIGLVLATPLTVCLVVMGRNVPRLGFLSILLSDDQPLTPREECYHRLLRADLSEATVLVDRFLKTKPLTALYDEVLVPVLISAEADHVLDELDHEHRAALHQGVRDLIDDLALHAASETAKHPPVVDPTAITTTPASATAITTAPASATPLRILCLPVRAPRDELAAMMLTQVLHQQGCEAQSLSAKDTADELAAAVLQQAPDAVCISVVAPSAMVHARNLCQKLRSRLPTLRIVIGFWGAGESAGELALAFARFHGVEVKTSLAEACAVLVEVPAAQRPARPDMVEEQPGIQLREQLPALT